jgi:hypothetical protein
MGLMPRPISRRLRSVASLALAALVALPELALATEPPAKTAAPAARSLDSMSPAELDRYVQQLNESANWRKYRRPNDPPDFVPGKPVRVMHGAGAAFGRGGNRGGRAFRQSGLARRRGGSIGSDRRRGRSAESAVESSRSRSGSSFGSSGSSSRSSSSRSSFGSSSRSSFGNGSGFDQ